MKRLTSIIVMTLLLTLTASAQDNKRPRFNPEEFRAKLEAFVIQKAGLSQEEADKVFPIYRQMRAKQRELKQKEHQLKKNAAQWEKDKDYQDALTQITQLRIESAKVEETYYKKMCKTISAKKVYAITLAEDAFHREMLQSFSHKKQDHQPPKKP